MPRIGSQACVCHNCSVTYYRIPSDAKVSKYCSYACRWSGMSRNQVFKVCPTCSKKFVAPRYREQRAKFCSKQCVWDQKVVPHTFFCSRCETQKTAAEFTKDKHRKSGYVRWCKPCFNDYQSKVTRTKPWRRMQEAQGAAVLRGIEWSLSKEQFMEFWQQPCAYCGDDVPFVGIDRVDNARGYTPDNCVSCCKHCNKMKNDMPYEEFVARCARIVERAAMRKQGAA